MSAETNQAKSALVVALRRLARIFWVILAIIFLFEAWLWAQLAPIVAFIVALLPLRAIKTKIASGIAQLSPVATLVVFIIPPAILFPIKLAAIWLFHHHYWFGGIAALVFAKLAGLGVTAFIFEVTRPKLMQMVWFATLYDVVMRGLGWAHAMVDPIKRRLRKYVRMLRPRNAGRFYRHFMRVRRRMRQPAAAG